MNSILKDTCPSQDTTNPILTKTSNNGTQVATYLKDRAPMHSIHVERTLDSSSSVVYSLSSVAILSGTNGCCITSGRSDGAGDPC